MGLFKQPLQYRYIEKQMEDCKYAGPDLNLHQNFKQKRLLLYVFYGLILWLLPRKAHKANSYL